jgi:hypothetical protein
MCYTGTSKRRAMENSNALDNPVSDRCRAAWRSPGGVGATPAQLSLVRQLHGPPWQCDGLSFHQSPSVRGDGVRDSRALLSKSALSLGTPAPTPHQLTRRSHRRGSPCVRPSVLSDDFGAAPAELFLPRAAVSRADVSLRRQVLLWCEAAVDGIGGPTSSRPRPLGRSCVFQIFLVVSRTYLPYMLPALETRM